MTFGIDIASPQRGIDLGRAKSEGVEFVIVKMGGLNVTPQYVAPHYKTQIDGAVAAGLPKGHYYLLGSGQSPEVQAEFFVANLYRFDKARDVLVLDNERLDSNGTRWGDGDAARFARKVIALTGIAAKQFWHYAGASDYRATGSWPELVALGVRFWWAAYGSYPTGKTPDHTPSLQGSIPRWDVHQYSSRVAIAGYSLDGNFSNHSIGELFGSAGSTPTGGGAKVTLEDQMRTFISANQAPRDAATWDQMCGSLMYRFNSWRGWKSQPVRDISSAYRAAMGSSLQADFMRAPVGAFHFFDIAGPANGHVMQDARGGGLVCLSSGYALSESLGRAIGFQSVPGYVAAKGARYLGWSLDYAGGTIDRSNLLGSGVNPIIDTPKGAPDMFLTRETNGTIYLQTGGGKVAIGNPAHVELINRMFKAWPGADTFNAAELDIINSYIVAANGSDSSDTAAILAAISKVAVDPEVVKAAVAAALANVSVTANVSPGDAKKIADAVIAEIAS